MTEISGSGAAFTGDTLAYTRANFRPPRQPRSTDYEKLRLYHELLGRLQEVRPEDAARDLGDYAAAVELARNGLGMLATVHSAHRRGVPTRGFHTPFQDDVAREGVVFGVFASAPTTGTHESQAVAVGLHNYGTIESDRLSLTLGSFVASDQDDGGETGPTAFEQLEVELGHYGSEEAITIDSRAPAADSEIGVANRARVVTALQEIGVAALTVVGGGQWDPETIPRIYDYIMPR